MSNASDGLAEQLARTADTGARAPEGATARVLLAMALAWSLFQIWYASPLPFALAVFNLNFVEARSLHLAFALFLAFLAFPAGRHSPRRRVPALDWALGLIGAAAAGYILVFQNELAQRPGAPIDRDIAVAVVGMVLLLEATRRALGLPLVVVAVVFLAYAFLGPWMPDVIAHAGASLTKAMSHQWITSEGVFGVALGVSTSFVFLFVLFGALLDRAGAGAWFIRVSYAALGHLRGGPAKAAVVSSGLTGMISGSSIANVVTTGTFTIPLMKRVGFPGEKAGAVEVASSVNGQIMPPVMGAAAFLMVEYVGIPYIDVIKHAFLPAVISYAALLYIVHLEALKAGLEGLPRPGGVRPRDRLISYGLTAAGLLGFASAVYWGLDLAKSWLGDLAPWAAGTVLALAYVCLLRLAARYPPPDDGGAIGQELPPLGPTVKGGLHYLVPVVVLVWCLMIERLSPGLSAFWATICLIVILLTQRPLMVLFAGKDQASISAGEACGRGLGDLLSGLVAGARNMIGIAIATAAAGIVVGTVTLTGLGLVMTEFVELISGGNLMLMLVFTAVISLILGMGLPTTANYIVVATLMAPVVVALAAQGGLTVPLIAVHLFVFYFGLMADVTPPVGLATFAAAAVSGADPIRTGVQAFFYSARTIALPFIFLFNTQLLLINIDDTLHLIITIASALVAMLVFAAATMGWFLDRSRIWETMALLLVAFILFRPGFFWDKVYPPYVSLSPSQVLEVAGDLPEDGFLRLRASGLDATGDPVTRAVVVPMGDDAPAEARLRNAGLGLTVTGEEARIASVAFGSAAEKVGLRAGWRIESVSVEADRPDKEWAFLPALVLLAAIAGLQHRRRKRSQ
ncbi:MAG TPA: TRAP transporter permease [Alphaproteobacteria bacterium]|nr:TRAP transporter permease [Alphaproteobacteria bacterium]